MGSVGGCPCLSIHSHSVCLCTMCLSIYSYLYLGGAQQYPGRRPGWVTLEIETRAPTSQTLWKAYSCILKILVLGASVLGCILPMSWNIAVIRSDRPSCGCIPMQGNRHENCSKEKDDGGRIRTTSAEQAGISSFNESGPHEPL